MAAPGGRVPSLRTARLGGADDEADRRGARRRSPRGARDGPPVAGDEATATLAGEAFVELLGPGVGKAEALAAIAADRGIAREEVVAFGDHLTDIGMLEWAGLGVAMANGHRHAVDAADEVARSNDEDGVAKVLERLLADDPGRRDPAVPARDRAARSVDEQRVGRRVAVGQVRDVVGLQRA